LTKKARETLYHDKFQFPSYIILSDIPNDIYDLMHKVDSIICYRYNQHHLINYIILITNFEKILFDHQL